MTTRLSQICEDRPDVRVLLYILGEQKILEWIHSVGVCEDQQLRSLVPALPPSELRMITAAPDLPGFLWTGLVDIARIMTLYESVTVLQSHKRPTVLDFGCGCGRMVRFLNNYANSWLVHACDVNPLHVQWCQENLNGIRTTQCSARPPLPYQDQTFDLVYGLSVFSHLSENNAANWLSEIRRLVVPTGIIIVTIHGLTALEVIRDSANHQKMFNLNRQSIDNTIEHFKVKPFVFHKYDQDALKNANAGEEYGNAFIHPDYVYEKWGTGGLKVLQHLPGGLRGWQDIVILQRTS